jgi:CO/xanthine dehydrogenase FAD-binding subunit
MDLIGVKEIRVPRTREEISFAPGERPLGGGTWLFSEEQPGLTGLVDLTALGWAAIDESDTALSIAATCTIAELTRLPRHPGWNAHPLIAQCANSLLASFKIWNVATVGGNIALGLPAGAMTSFAASLDADALIWTPDGGERRMPVASFVTGVRQTALVPGEILRSIEIHRTALVSKTAFRRIALSPLGRSGTLVIGRVAPSGEAIFTITAATPRPVQLRFDELPNARALQSAVFGIHDWYNDPHGAPDWRRATAALFAEEIRIELGGVS